LRPVTLCVDSGDQPGSRHLVWGRCRDPPLGVAV